MMHNLNLIDKNTRITSIDFLRGISACAVMLFHYTASTSINISDNNPLRVIGIYGHWGTIVFFVVSGFVIPYSMYNSLYEIKSIGKFLLKRSLRIEIPFLVILILEVIMIYISSWTPWRDGVSERLDAGNIILHIGYLNGILGKPWLIPIFWTLAIEFQFYLLMSILFPMLTMSRGSRITIVLGIILLSFLFPQPYLFFSYGLFFLMGILTFQWVVKLINLAEFISLTVMVLFSLYMQADLFSVLLVIGVLLTLLFFKWEWKWSGFLGAISYSLYLVHVPFGGRLLLLARLYVENEWAKSALILLFFVSTIFVTWIFYLIVERPSLLLSKRFRYKPVDS